MQYNCGALVYDISMDYYIRSLQCNHPVVISYPCKLINRSRSTGHCCLRRLDPTVPSQQSEEKHFDGSFWSQIRTLTHVISLDVTMDKTFGYCRLWIVLDRSPHPYSFIEGVDMLKTRESWTPTPSPLPKIKKSLSHCTYWRSSCLVLCKISSTPSIMNISWKSTLNTTL